MDDTIQVVTAKTCRNCQVSNLTEEIRIQRCKQCASLYCVHFASNIDPQFCVECLSDVTLHKESIVKTYMHEHYDEETDTITQTEYRRRATEYKLEGTSWLFNQRKIVQMSDDSLELAIEYHRGLLQGMMNEREDRRNKKMHRFAGIPSGMEGVSSSKSSSTTVKKSKTISSNKAGATAASVMSSMLAGGMDAAQLLALLQAAQKGVTK